MLSDKLVTDRSRFVRVYTKWRSAAQRRHRHQLGAGFSEAAAAQIGRLTGLAFVTASKQVPHYVQGAHDAQVQLSEVADARCGASTR